MQGPWRIFLIQSESEKARIFLLSIIIYIYVKLRWFSTFVHIMHLANVIMQQDCQLFMLAKCQ